MSFLETLQSGAKGGGSQPAPATPAVPGATATPAPTTKAAGGFLGSLQANPATGPKAPTTSFSGALPPSPMLTPPAQKYFSTVDKATGTSIGFSAEKDASGLPYLAYKNPGDTATTTDLTRVATSFDPRIPKALTPGSFTTPRAVANRAALKTSMGGAYSDELDHAIALELAGSNNEKNLIIQPGRIGGTAATSDKLETSLAHQVVSGQLSLWEAQTQLARNKGVSLPYIGDSISKYEQRAYDSKKAADYAASPLGLAENTFGTIGNWAKDLASAVVDHVKASVSSPGGLLTTAEGTVQSAVLKPLAFGEGISNGILDAIASVPNTLFGTHINQTLVNDGGDYIHYINTSDPRLAQYRQDNGLDPVFTQLAQMNKDISRSPSDQKAFDTGNFIGWLVPYSKIASGVEAAAGLAGIGTTIAPKLAPLIPYISDAVGFLGTGQILHSPDEGSRVTQLRNDALALALFDVGGFALKGAGALASKGLSSILAPATKDAVQRALAPVIAETKDGGKVSIDTLDHAVTEAKDAVVEATGKDPKELLQQHLDIAPAAAEGAAKTEAAAPVTPRAESAPIPKSSEDAAQTYWDSKLAQDAKNGKPVVVGADDLKDFFSNDYNTANHKIYSAATDQLYKRALQETKGDTVRFTLGGPGAGKSDFLVPHLKDNFNGIVYDSTAWNYEGIKKQMTAAETAGKKVEVYGIVPDLERARAYTFARAEQGLHPVSETGFVRTHSAAIDTAIKLIQDGKDVWIRDLRGVTTREQVARGEFLHNPLALLERVRYNEDHVRAKIKHITPETARDLIAGKKAEQANVGGRQAGGAGLSAEGGAGAKLAKAAEPHETALHLKYETAPKGPEELSNVMAELLELSQAGFRIMGDMTHGGTETIGVSSTFPKWLPDHLKSMDLFRATFEGLQDIKDIHFPSNPRSVKQRELYNEVLSTLDYRLGVDTSKERSAILNLYGDSHEIGTKTAKETAADGSGGVAGEGGAGAGAATETDFWGRSTRQGPAEVVPRKKGSEPVHYLSPETDISNQITELAQKAGPDITDYQRNALEQKKEGLLRDLSHMGTEKSTTAEVDGQTVHPGDFVQYHARIMRFDSVREGASSLSSKHEPIQGDAYLLTDPLGGAQHSFAVEPETVNIPTRDHVIDEYNRVAEWPHPDNFNELLNKLSPEQQAPAAEAKPAEAPVPSQEQPTTAKSKEDALSALKEMTDKERAAFIDTLPDRAKAPIKEGLVSWEDVLPAWYMREIKLPDFPAGNDMVFGVAFPGAQYIARFVEKDIVDKFANARDAITGIYSASKDLLTPSATTEKAEGIVGAAIMKVEKYRSAAWKVAEKRRDWWAQMKESDHNDFIDKLEAGNATPEQFTKYGPGVGQTMSDLANEYRARLDRQYEWEKDSGVKHNYVEEYLPHWWKDPERAKVVFQQHMDAMGTGYFTKARTIDLIKTGRELGLELKTTNPEELVLMREIDGMRVLTKVDMMQELKSEGLSVPVKTPSGEPSPGIAGWPVVKGADGKSYAVPPDAARVLKHAFFEKSLWSTPGFFPSIFRGLMAIKGTLVPIQLSLSAFHPIHIAFIHSASERARTWEGIIKGNLSLADGLKQLGKPTAMLTQIGDVGEYYNIIKAWDKPMSDLSPRQRQVIQYIVEGGGSPKMSEELMIRAKDGFKKAVNDQNYIGAGIRGIPKLIEAYQRPVFESYIPALKVASYTRGVESLLKARPELATDGVARKAELHKLWKSIDNRYGQMVYKTLFWHPIIKEVGQASFLSLGWNLGFVREFGGGAIDLAKLSAKLVGGTATGGRVLDKATVDDVTQRMLFSIDYTIQAALVGGLMTYAMTGKLPQSAQDLFFPATGDTNPDGSAARVNTSFYTREWFGFQNHLAKEGVIGGSVALVQNKLNPILRNLAEIYQNKDFYGYEIRSPNANVAQQAEQLFSYFLKSGITPISLAGAQQAGPISGIKGQALAFAGFNPAPKYIAESPIQTQIFSTLDHRTGGTKPLDSKPAADAKTNIRKLYQQGKIDEANTALDKAVTDGYIKPTGKTTFVRNLDLPADVRAFKSLAQYPSDQEELLSQMNAEDLARYSSYAANSVKAHLSSLSPTAKQFVADLNAGKIKLMTFKAGVPVPQ